MELWRALAVCAEPPTTGTGRVARLLELPAVPTAADYTEVFTLQLYPYASVYLGPEGMLGGEARDRIAGFWRALGEHPPAEPDHLTCLLGAYADLTGRAGAAPHAGHPWARARAAFLWEHVLSWVPAYALAVRAIAPPAYAAWAELVLEALANEAAAVPPPHTPPLHLRDAPGFVAADAGLDELVAALLAPVRSGVILTRTDLRRAAAAIGTGLRAGERRYALGALLRHMPAEALTWLRDETRRRASAYEGLPAAGTEAGRFWIARARATAAVLDELARDARVALGATG